MKKLLLLLFIPFLTFGQDYTYVPDDNFEQALINLGYDNVLDNFVSTQTIQSVYELNVADMNISSLEGIEDFVSLTYLACDSNNISTLDVSNLTQLEHLDCWDNNLTELDVSNNNNLTHLSITVNDISEIDISNLTQLTYFGANFCELNELDLSNNDLIETLWCAGNNLTEIDVSNLTQLETFLISSNNLTEIDISNNNLLTYFGCGYQNITQLDVSNNTELTTLSFHEANISYIDVSNNTQLTSLWCYDNNLTFLDVSCNTELTMLWAHNNDIDFIQVWDIEYAEEREAVGSFTKDSNTQWAFSNCSPVIAGCTDSNAFNYNPSAQYDDGSCCYIGGCMDFDAVNFDTDACFDDGSCAYDYDCDYLLDIQSYYDTYDNSISNYYCYYYMSNGGWGYTIESLTNAGYACECVEPYGGCTNSAATNYNLNSLFDDGSCEYDCDYLLDIQSYYDTYDNSISNYYCNYYATNGTYTFAEMLSMEYACECVEIYGCTEESACNYNPFANIDDGGCGSLDNCGTCDDDPNNDCEFDCDLGDLTYVPDDSFENYIETNFPDADNGVANDNYVLTAGLDLSDNNNTTLSFSENNLDDPIFDLTGIENIKGIYGLNLSGSSVLIQNLDLSCLQLKNNIYNNGSFNCASINISNCMFLENLILPSDTFSLSISGNANLENVEFQPGAYYPSISIGTPSYSNNEALCYVNIKGTALNNSFNLSVYDNNYVYNLDDYSNNGISVDLLEFNSTYGVSAYFYDYYYYLQEDFSWQVRFNEDIYDWTSVTFNWYSANEYCVDVADPAYAEAYWPSYSTATDYSTDCWSASNINCANFVSINESTEKSKGSLFKVFDLLGRETTNKGFQLHIYDDGTVEKKYLIK